MGENKCAYKIIDWRALVGQTIDERVISEWISEKYRVSLKLLNCQTFLPLTCLPLWRGYLNTLCLLVLPTDKSHMPKSGT
jgi:hypothetical protein